MTVRDTSRSAYWRLQTGRKITQAQGIVLDALMRLGSASRALIAYDTGMPINAVCGRVNELLKLKVVQDGRTEIDPSTLKRVHVVELV